MSAALHGEIEVAVALAHQEGCDKIIMGLRGESLIEELLIGSVVQMMIA